MTTATVPLDGLELATLMMSEAAATAAMTTIFATCSLFLGHPPYDLLVHCQIDHMVATTTTTTTNIVFGPSLQLPVGCASGRLSDGRFSIS